MKKILLFIVCIFFTGCASYVELSSLDVASNLGIDYYDDKFHVTITTISKNEDEKEYTTYTSSGKTLDEAIQNIQLQEHKKLYIAHLHLLILTPNIISSKLTDVLEFFLQNTESRNDFSLAISDSITFLEEEQENLQEMIEIIEENLGTTKSIQFENFISNLLNKEILYLPTIKQQENIKVSGITLLEDNKIVGVLSEEETILFNLLNNSLKQTSLLDTKILSNQTFFTYSEDKLLVTLECILANENKEFSKKIEDILKEMYEKYKEKNIDVFGLTTYLKGKTALKNLKIDFEIKIKTEQQTEKEIDIS